MLKRYLGIAMILFGALVNLGALAMGVIGIPRTGWHCEWNSLFE
jgi:hypothetical protein